MASRHWYLYIIYIIYNYIYIPITGWLFLNTAMFRQKLIICGRLEVNASWCILVVTSSKKRSWVLIAICPEDSQVWHSVTTSSAWSVICRLVSIGRHQTVNSHKYPTQTRKCLWNNVNTNSTRSSRTSGKKGDFSITTLNWITYIIIHYHTLSYIIIHYHTFFHS